MSDLETLIALDKAHVIHPISDFAKHEQRGAKIVTGGKGIRIETGDGRQLIDGLSGLFNINVGHGRTEIGEAVAAQMSKTAYYPAFWDYSTEPAIRLAKRLVDLLPADRKLRHVLFTSGGSDANETNFRIARLYHALRGNTQKQKILSRRQAYHGITRAAGSATTLPAYHLMQQRDPDHIESASHYCLRCEFNKSYPGCGLPCVEDVAAVIEREGAETIAAVIAEPVQGTGGIISPPDEYFPRLAEICHEHDLLLILDEVITGFGRTGRWFGMEHWGITPDLVSFAKGITSGYLPLGGVAVSDHVYETLRDESHGLPFMTGLTYNNHAAACAAGLANLDIVEREGLVENARDVGAYLLECLRESFTSHPLVADVRGIGMLAAIETSQAGSLDPVAGRPMAFPAAVASQCYGEGLIVRPLWECVALAPPLITTRSDVDEIVTILESAFAAVTPGFLE
jgi:adenosylmethionine-8-amino-7-oxononanoate aminotransferase